MNCAISINLTRMACAAEESRGLTTAATAMRKFQLFLFLLLAAIPARAHPGHGKNHGHSHPLMLPFVERVDAQPLLVQCGRLAEALQALGAPLPGAALAALRDGATQQDDAALTRLVQDLLDPLSIAALEIGADGRLEATPALNGLELQENRPRTVLLKVINKAGVSTRLRAASPSAHWLTLAVHDQRPLSADLSGLELEYRVLKVSASGRGERMATVEFNVSGLPGRKSALIRQWRFAKGGDGWSAHQQAQISGADGLLEFTATGADAFMRAPVEARSGRMKLRFQAQSEVAGTGRLAWFSSTAPDAAADGEVSFQLTKGAAQVHEIEFEASTDLTAIRLSPAAQDGKVRFDWIDLEYAHGDGGDWAPMRMKFKTVE